MEKITDQIKGIKIMKSIINKLTKFCTEEIIFYFIFGVFTSIINIGTFWIMTKLFNWNENVSNFIAIVLAILFSYFANKDVVFHANAESFKQKIQQFTKFVLGRLFTMAIEFIGGIIFFTLPIPHIITKCALSVIVIILNFFISKFFAFKQK